MFSERLTQLRNERGLTQKELSEILFIDRSTYAQYEIGRREPDFATLSKFADYFLVSTDYLLGRTTYRNPAVSPIEKQSKEEEDIDNAVRQLMVAVANASKRQEMAPPSQQLENIVGVALQISRERRKNKEKTTE